MSNKVKHFLWKGFRDYLAWCLNLNWRDMRVEALCQSFWMEDESLGHALFVSLGSFGTIWLLLLCALRLGCCDLMRFYN